MPAHSSATVEHLLRRHRHDDEVDPVGEFPDAAAGPDALYDRTGAVDRIDAAREAVLQDVAEHSGADRVWTLAGADDCDRIGSEQSPEGGELRLPVATVECVQEVGPRGEVEVVMHDVVADDVLDAEPRVAEDLGHAAVPREHLGHEATDSVGPSPTGEMLEQQGADAQPVFVVRHRESDLRRRARRSTGLDQTRVARHPDEATVMQQDQPRGAGRAGAEQAGHVLVPGVAAGGEEPQVRAVRREGPVQLEQRGFVARMQGAQPGGTAVPQDDVDQSDRSRLARGGLVRRVLESRHAHTLPSRRRANTGRSPFGRDQRRVPRRLGARPPKPAARRDCEL